MSILLKTVQAFPRGRTTEELLVLVGAGFSHDKRVSAIAELDELLNNQLVVRGRDGRWRPKHNIPSDVTDTARTGVSASGAQGSNVIIAAPANFFSNPVDQDISEDLDDETATIDPQALLRYWRSALRADPRGATTQVGDKHGIEWNLISGRGPIAPGEGESLSLRISLDALNPTFREALVRREGHENALAVGWPMAVARRGGVPIFQPVGLLAAAWERDGDNLVLKVETDDVVVNPDWIKSAARVSGWKREALDDMFDAEDGLALRAATFIEKLKDAVASQIRGRIVGEDLASQLDADSQGIFDSAAIFLPSDSSFTAGAARDLDAIATWPEERMARTALAAIFGLDSTGASSSRSAINMGALNAEQLRAVRHACIEPLTVVTGPPGTGKSQAIVSMAASVLLSGGSVLVASKNHQALDAVEDRLGALAPDAPFVTRTLKPEDDLDVGFLQALKRLIAREHIIRGAQLDDHMIKQLYDAAVKRGEAIKSIERMAELECEVAELLEKIQFREQHSKDEPTIDEANVKQVTLLRRLMGFIGRLFRPRGHPAADVNDAGTNQWATLDGLRARVEQLREMRKALVEPDDPMALGDIIRDLAQKALPALMAQRTRLTEERRQEISEALDDWEFAGGRGQLPTDISHALVNHRPLWLASILGTPRRIPLDDGLFDLVIFDEASQCDIATAVPLMARAKRAVVVGDDQQLSFIAQLGQAQDRNLMQAQNLPVAKMGRFAQSRRSLFDFASRVPDVARVTLRHQYRSAGPIVEYISENFYGGQLETSYDPSSLVVPRGAKPGIAWQHVPAPTMPQNGNVNPSEVSAILRHLRNLLLQEDYTGSVGVITPFRAQVMALGETHLASQRRDTRDTSLGHHR